MTTTYAVEVQTAPLAAMSEETLDAFSEALFRDCALRGPAPGASLVTRTLSVRTSVDVERGGPQKALGIVLEAFARAAKSAGVRAYELADIAIELDIADDAPPRSDLIGTPELAERLGVTRERIRQLAQAPGRFPSPVATVRDTRIWRWGDIADWIAVGGRRKTGRPRKVERPASAPAKRKRGKAA